MSIENTKRCKMNYNTLFIFPINKEKDEYNKLTINHMDV